MSSRTLSDLDLAIKLVKRLGGEAEGRVRIIYSILSDASLDEESKKKQVATVWNLIGISNTDATIQHTLAISTIALRSTIIANLDFEIRSKVRAKNNKSGAMGTYMWTKTQDEQCLVEVIDPFGQSTYLDPIRYTFTRIE